MPAKPAVVRRRSVLAAAGAMVAAAAGACTSGKKPKAKAAESATAGASRAAGGRAPASPNPTPSPAASKPDRKLLEVALMREVNLLTTYRAALRDAPDAAPLLEDFRLHHEAHIERLEGLAGNRFRPDDSVAPPAGIFGPAPVTAKTVITHLTRHEGRAAADGAADCATAGATEFAVLLAEIAACEAQHGALLPTFPIPAKS